jgi:WD40 repeat protein
VAIAVSDMGSHIAVGFASGGGSIFHTTRLLEPAAFASEVEGPLTAIAWSPTALRDGPAAVLAHAAGEANTVLKCLHLGSGHRDASVDFNVPVCSVQWLKLVPAALAVSTGEGRCDHANSVLIVPVPQHAGEPMAPTRTFSSHTDPVRWCVVDTGHATMATAAAGADGTIRFWQSVVSDAAHVLDGHTVEPALEDFDTVHVDTMHTVR